MQEIKQKLDSLRQLKDGGAISEADFDREKQKLLDQLTGAGVSPGTTPQGGSIVDLGAVAGQALFIGPPNRQYRIERSLGKGGFGEVFLAEDVETSRQLGAVTWRAVKVLHKNLAADELSRKRLTQEATQVQQLRHKHIVAVYDWSIDPVQDTPFLVMEYLKGSSLSGVLAERLGRGGYTLAEALELLRPVAQALDYAWAEHKLVHRDLKPDNLFITDPGGVIKLLDFGIAARMRSTASTAGIQVLERAGTLDYAPPEAAAKQKAWQPSHDVYSLAVVLYQLLDPEHELPFQQRAPGTAWPSRPEGLSDTQWEVLKQGLAYRQEERAPAAGAFLDAFEGAEQREAERSEAERKETERKAGEEAERAQDARRRAAEEAREREAADRRASATVKLGSKTASNMRYDSDSVHQLARATAIETPVATAPATPSEPPPAVPTATISVITPATPGPSPKPVLRKAVAALLVIGAAALVWVVFTPSTPGPGTGPSASKSPPVPGPKSTISKPADKSTFDDRKNVVESARKAAEQSTGKDLATLLSEQEVNQPSAGPGKPASSKK